MTQKISRKQAIGLIVQMHKIIVGHMELWNYFDDYRNMHMTDVEQESLGVQLEYIEVQLESVSNGYLSQFFHTILGCDDIEVCGEIENRYTCQCCGYKTLDEIGGYDICPYCNWEDDGTTDINMKMSINHGSIQDYRDKIKNNPNKYYIDKWLR
jgi:hypothetical protein